MFYCKEFRPVEFHVWSHLTRYRIYIILLRGSDYLHMFSQSCYHGKHYDLLMTEMYGSSLIYMRIWIASWGRVARRVHSVELETIAIVMGHVTACSLSVHGDKLGRRCFRRSKTLFSISDRKAATTLRRQILFDQLFVTNGYLKPHYTPK